MRGFRAWKRVPCIAGPVAALVAVAAGADAPNVRLTGVPGMAVRQAVEGASLRLETPSCRQVLTDFQDLSGRPLRVVLDELGETPASYLRGLVFFYDGASRHRCASGDTLASTSPGSRVVYVCPLQFSEVYRRDARLAEALIIHETLHSLGLGENPPASIEITQRVLARCSERAAMR